MKLNALILRTFREARRPHFTAYLAGACAGELSNARGRVWSELTKLERAGLVRRLKGRRHSSGRPVRWEVA